MTAESLRWLRADAITRSLSRPTALQTAVDRLGFVQADPIRSPARAQDVVAGKVAETMDSGGYTYVRLVQGKDSSWAAMPKQKVKVGDRLSLGAGVVMNNFNKHFSPCILVFCISLASLLMGEANFSG